MGKYDEQHSYGSSGWEGELSRHVLDRIAEQGIISKNIQTTLGCGELKEYPENGAPIPSSLMSFDEYHQHSKFLAHRGIITAPILDAYATIFGKNEVSPKNLIADIKKTIDKNHRVVIAVLLPAVDLGIAGAVGTHRVENDTWVLSTIIEREFLFKYFFPGHAMVLTGYDDKAVAIDDLGRTHKGLFTLRNSWGSAVGDKGDFYMSYDYFKVLGLEAYQVGYEEAYDDGREL